MNIGIIGSFIIGGIVLISLLNLQFGIFRNANQNTFEMATKQQIDALVEIAEYDFPKIGYRVGQAAINSATSRQLTFQSDLYDQNTVNTITWRFNPTQANTRTANPNDRILERIIDGQSAVLSLNVIDFELQYLNSMGVQTTNVDSIRGIHLRVICESPAEAYGKFSRAAWEKTFYPVNLRLAVQ